MDKAETLDLQLTMILEKLKKLRDGNSEQLPSLEKYVQSEICALMDAEAPFRLQLMIDMEVNKAIRDEKIVDNMVQCSGSLVEGAMMARLFQNIDEWREMEVDVMHNMFTIRKGVSHLLESVENKVGFVRLPFCPELCSVWFYELYIGELGSEIERDIGNARYNLYQIQYISPLLIKNFCKFEYDKVDLGPLPTRQSCEKTETTVEMKYQRRQRDGSIFHMSHDYVPAVRLLFWPHQTAAWITRHRRWWPQQDTIQRIVKEGCQLVPRSSPGGNIHTEWRLSFSVPEATLAQLRSKTQQQAS